MKIEETSAHQKQIYLALRNERKQMIRKLTSYVVYYYFKRNKVL